MARMKTFLIYLIVFVLFYLFSDIAIYGYVKQRYYDTETRIEVDAPKIEVTDSKATFINGYILGKITNNTNETIENKYIKMDFYTKRDVKAGTKYAKINNLGVNQTSDFEARYNYEQVKYAVISITDNVEGVPEKEFTLDAVQGFSLVLGAAIILYLMGF